MYTALRLQKKLSRKAEITVVDPQSNMTYQPFLPEAAAGSLEPRHVVVPLRKVLHRCRVITATVTRIEHARKIATVLPSEGEGYEVGYDLLVVCPGSVSRLLPIPGLAEHGIGFKTIGEAIYLRNHVLSRLDLAASVTDPERRRRALSFVLWVADTRAWRRSPNSRTWRVMRCVISTASTYPTCGGCSSKRRPE